jgi:hypothetical protein
VAQPVFRSRSQAPSQAQSLRLFPEQATGHASSDLRAQLGDEVENEQKEKGESPRHRRAQAATVAALKDAIARGVRLQWSYRDPRLNFSFKGNLLADAVDAVPNYRLQTPSGQVFYADVAILGPAIGKTPLVLGAIEIEFTHEFSMAKCLLLRSLGFPLFSVDVTESTENELDERWAQRVLEETTWRSPDDRRRNYVYLNDVLAPVFVDLRELARSAPNHQFLVFSSDNDLARLERWLALAAEKLGLRRPREFHANRVNAKSPSSRKAVENAGEIAGEGWRTMNADSHLLVQLARPRQLKGPLYQMHLLLARLVSSQISAIVGYRCEHIAWERSDGLWLAYDRPSGEGGGTYVPFMPCQVAYPAAWVLEALGRLKR